MEPGLPQALTYQNKLLEDFFDVINLDPNQDDTIESAPKKLGVGIYFS